MEEVVLNQMLRKIKNGKDVIATVKYLTEEISMLRWHAEFGGVPAETRKFLHKHANEIENQLYFACEYFVKGTVYEE